MEGGLLPPKAVPRKGPLPKPPVEEAEAEGEAVRVPNRPPSVVVGDAAAAADEVGVLVVDMRPGEKGEVSERQALQ
jgi:hypothetical protein